MISPQDIRIADFTYDLPDERIARHPLPDRDASRLIVYRNGMIGEDTYRNIAGYLDPGALLVFNDTRVIPARLEFSKSTGARIEVFCLEPEGEITTGMTQTGTAVWKCLVGGAQKWKNDPLLLDTGPVRLQADLLERGRESCRVRFSWTPSGLTFAEMLQLSGQIPLPPYVQRPVEAADRERYQTIYAQVDGSVAAPTAGLHFTERVFQRLAGRGIESAYLTLHVGAGTFRPVKSDTIGEHEMHGEYMDVPAAFIRRLMDRKSRGQVVAVGTTSLRTLESLYLLGCKLHQNTKPIPGELHIGQWDAFDPAIRDITPEQALKALTAYLDRQGADRLIAKTQLLIAPGYCVRMADALVTNFHQPSSTLLLLVAAFVGPGWRRIYNYALEHDFRFLIYGDGSLLFRNRA